MQHPLRVFALLILLMLPLVSQERARLSFEDVYGRARAAYSPSMPRPWRYAYDGNTLLNAGGEPLEATTLKATTLPPEPAAPPSILQLMEAALQEAGSPTNRSTLQGRPSRSTLPRAAEPVPGLRATPDGEHAAVLLDGDLWAYTRGQNARRVLAGVGAIRRFEIAPDGKAVSFISGYDLHLIQLRDGKRLPLSSDGSEDFFYGELDWVYQEEVYGRFNFKATWWANSGEHLAFMRIDETGVDTFTVVDHIPNQLAREELKYPKAGRTNPKATLHVANSRTGDVVKVDLSKYPPEDEILIVAVDWTPDSGAVVFSVQNREQTWLDLNAADPKTGKVVTLLRETSSSWVNVPSPLHWLKDGTFLFESERTGYKHIYRYRADGTLMHPVTSGPWQVLNVLSVHEEQDALFFMGTKDGAISPNVYRVSLSGKDFVRLTPGRGSHRVTLDKNGDTLLSTVSSLVDPPRQLLLNARTGEIIKETVRGSLPSAQETYGLSLPEWVRIPCRDGFELDATIIKPLPFDGARRYPVWIETYSGPAAPTVRDSFSVDPWLQFLAQQGIVVLQVNVRSAANSGQVHTATCYKQFGVQELRDLDDAVDWLGKNAWVDTDRVGITGWSYGGFMTAFALTNSKKYRVGIAGAGVYDWRLYDTIYTERYMAIPKNNEEGYRASSVVESAKNLHGHLLIIHGSMDDNVHLQNAMQLVYALQRAGKQFEMMFYPKSRHGIGDPALSKHHRTLVWNTIQKHLLN